MGTKIMKFGVKSPVVVRDSGCWGEKFTLNRDGGGEIYVQDWGSRGGVIHLFEYRHNLTEKVAVDK